MSEMVGSQQKSPLVILILMQCARFERIIYLVGDNKQRRVIDLIGVVIYMLMVVAILVASMEGGMFEELLRFTRYPCD